MIGIRAQLVICLLAWALSGPALPQDVAKFIAVPQDAAGQEPHARGFVRENPTKYQAIKEVSRFRAFYPPKWDLSPSLPPPGNQGKQSSCVAWAVGYAARSYYLHKDYNADTTQASNILSPAFIYNSLHDTKDKCTEGTSIIDALHLLQNKGGVPLADLPYDPKQCSAVPSAETLSRFGERFRIDGYQRVEAKNADDVKGQLYSGNPIIFAIDIPKGFEHYNATAGVIDDSDDRGYEFGHAMVLVGYDDERQAYKFVNSWGPRWGDHGFGWISYRAASALWLSGYVMKVTPPANPPAPAPGPAPAPATQHETPPQPAPAPSPNILPQPAPGPPQIELTAACSKLAAETRGDGTGFAVKLSGFVGSTDDLQRIRTAALSQGLVTRLDATDVALRPWPQCEALLTLDSAMRNRRGTTVTRTESEARLVKGSRMIFDVTSPDYPSYLYVAYIQADGTAAHLLRPTGEAVTPPNTQIRLGDTQGQPKYRVGPPYGREMVVVLASDHPLLDEEMLGPVRERQLLSAYRRAMLGGAGKGASAAILPLETSEQ